jgi:hypothetical protein
MSKLELPADVADKVVGMLKPRFRPSAVLIFKYGDNPIAYCERKIMMKAGALSEDELSFLVSQKPIITWDDSNTPEFAGKRCWDHYIIKKEEKGILELNLHYMNIVDEARTAAILLGFQYRSKENNQGMITDVLYRDAHREFPDIA